MKTVDGGKLALPYVAPIMVITVLQGGVMSGARFPPCTECGEPTRANEIPYRIC